MPGLTSGAGGQTFEFANVFEGSRIGVTADGAEFSIPTSDGFFTFGGDGQEPGLSPLGPISGGGFFDPDNEFTFAVFRTAAGDTGAFLAGEASGALATPATAGRVARGYAISDDLFTGGGAPFTPESLSGFSADGRSDLILLSDGSGAATGGDARALSTYLSIEGEGAAQSSGFGVLTANVEAAGGGSPAFTGQFDGVFSDGNGSTRVATPVATAEDGSGGSAFGADAENLALTNNRQFDAQEAAFGGAFNQTGEDAPFGSNNVASLTSTSSNLSDASQTFTGGFAATAGVDLGDGDNFAGVSGENGVTGTVAPGENQAEIALRLNFFSATGGGEPDLTDLTVAFGGNGATSGAVDADQFAARGVDADANGVGTLGFSGAIASSGLTGDGGVFPAGVNTAPQFLTWGWWAGEAAHDPNAVAASDAGGSPLDSDQRFHLGAWVGGDITAAANLPFEGVATYDGFAAISVVDNGASYVDGGGFTLTYDFGDRFGAVQFTDLLGQDPTIAVTDDSFDAAYEGVADIQVGGREGLIAVRGSFFNAGEIAAGATAGSIGVQTLDNTVTGAGVFGGDRTSFTLEPSQ